MLDHDGLCSCENCVMGPATFSSWTTPLGPPLDMVKEAARQIQEAHRNRLEVEAAGLLECGPIPLQWRFHRLGQIPTAARHAPEPIPYPAFRALCEETVRLNAPAALVLTDRTSPGYDALTVWIDLRGVKRERSFANGAITRDRIVMDLVWLCDDLKKELGERAAR